MNPRARLLMALVLGLSVLAAGLLWWQTSRAQAQLREQLLAEAEQRSLHLADAMAGQVQSLLGVLDVGLVSVRREWQHHRLDFPEAARGALQALPDGLGLRLSMADAQGRTVFHSGPGALPAPGDDAARWQALREGGDRLHVGLPQRSGTNGGNGEWVLVLARPVLREGRFEGAVLIELPGEVLAQRLGTLELASRDVVALLDREGVFLARSRANEAAMAQRVAADRGFVDAPVQPRGSVRIDDAVDGMARVQGWRRIEPLDLVVTVGLAEEGVLAPLAPAVARARELTRFFSLVLLLGGIGLALLLRRVARSEAQTRAALALRNRLFDSSQVPMGVMDPDNARLLECNDAAVRAYGLGSRERTVGCHLTEVSAAEQRHGRPAMELARERVAQALRDGLAVFEWRHKRPDGQCWDAEVHLMPFASEGRSLLQFTAIDITARRLAESRLQASEARLKEAQRIAAIGSWELDLRTRQARWSDEVYRILELEPGAAAESFELFMTRVHPEDREALQQSYSDIAKARAPRDLVHRLRMPDGRIKHVRHTGFTEYEDGRPLRSVGTVQDITEVREAEAALQRLNEELEDRVAERTRELSLLNRELESFAYSVSHDLRAPLRGIHGFAELLAEDQAGRLGAEGLGYLGRIRQAADGMGRLIEALLSLSRVSRVELRHDWVDISALARQQAAELGAGEPQRAAQWHIEDGLRAWGDPALLQAVLQNLLGNAWKYSRHCAHTEIRVERAAAGAGEAAFAVSDNGAGFDMQHAAQLFEPFKRLHSAREFEGTGVGLATVQRIVERHGGWIRGEGERGRGARFSVGLPWPAEAGAPAPGTTGAVTV